MVVGTREWLERHGCVRRLHATGDTAPGVTRIYVGVDGQSAGYLDLLDTPRPGARETVAELHRMGASPRSCTDLLARLAWRSLDNCACSVVVLFACLQCRYTNSSVASAAAFGQGSISPTQSGILTQVTDTL